MKVLILIFASLANFAHAADAPPAASPTVAPTAAPVAPAPSATPAAAPVVSQPTGPVAKDKTYSYSTRTAVQTCTPEQKAKCLIDTFVVAKDLVNDALSWERRIYFQHYDLDKPLDGQTITIKSLAIVNKKAIVAKNSRGDSFELSIDHGHMKRPKDAREYSK